MAEFILSGDVRGLQLVDEILQGTGIDVTGRFSFYPPDKVVIVGPDVDSNQAAIQAIVDGHVPDATYFDEDVERINKHDVIDRLNLTTLAGKSPAEIYTIVESRIDSWTSLAEAKTDLRDWMPLIFAAVYWLVKQQQE